MGRRREEEPPPSRRLAEATTAEGRIAQVGAAAYALAEEQILAGTASSQVQLFFLKENSPRAQLELQALEADVNLRNARVEQIHSQARIEDLYVEAIQAIKGYQGHPSVEVPDELTELD